MSQFKPITRESIPRALDKAERYRLLNEPFFAESICLDVLAIDPANQRALAIHVLAVCDQFPQSPDAGPQRARAIAAKLESEYERLYYAGIVSERQAVVVLHRSGHDSASAAWRHIHEAMGLYEKAHDAQHDKTNDDATLRYNTCVRLLEAHKLSAPAHEHHDYPLE